MDINNYYINDSNKLDQLIKSISNKLNDTILIEESQIDHLYTILKSLCKNHNDKIKNWFDEKYESDLKIFFDTNLFFNKISSDYEKNCYISFNLEN